MQQDWLKRAGYAQAAWRLQHPVTSLNGAGMTRRRSLSPGPIWLILAAALLLRSIVPTGWMPMSDGNSIRIMLCDGFGPAAGYTANQSNDHVGPNAGTHDHESMHGEGHGEDAPHDPCPFGLALASALDVADPPAAVLPLEAVAAPASSRRIAARLVAASGLRPHARAPPQLA